MAAMHFTIAPPAGRCAGRRIPAELAAKLKSVMGSSQWDEALGEPVEAFTTHQVPIANARQIKPSLAQHGIEMRRWPTHVVNFGDDAELRRTYHPEMIELVTAVLMDAGRRVSKVIVIDHLRRCSLPPEYAGTSLHNPGAGAPPIKKGETTPTAAAVPRVHCDYSAASGFARARQLLDNGGGGGGGETPCSKAAIVNIWRPVDLVVPRMPFALCDASSVGRDAWFDYALVAPSGGVLYNSAVEHDLGQRWMYWPQQTRDECTIFMLWDADETSNTRFVPHAAFQHPETPPEAPQRTSVECRMLVLFD